MVEARHENLLARIEEKLRARRRSDLISLLAGIVTGAAAGVVNAVLAHKLLIAYAIVIALYALGFYAARLISLRSRLEYSLMRSLVTYSSSFILWWFSLYASLIQ